MAPKYPLLCASIVEMSQPGREGTPRDTAFGAWHSPHVLIRVSTLRSLSLPHSLALFPSLSHVTNQICDEKCRRAANLYSVQVCVYVFPGACRLLFKYYYYEYGMGAQCLKMESAAFSFFLACQKSLCSFPKIDIDCNNSPGIKECAR